MNSNYPPYNVKLGHFLYLLDLLFKVKTVIRSIENLGGPLALSHLSDEIDDALDSILSVSRRSNHDRIT